MASSSTRILAIETSCDESALAIVDCFGTLASPRFKVVNHVIASQIDIHRPFGGVVPNLAKREHIKNLPVLLRGLNLTTADWKRISAIAVTVGPGLEPALWTGINFAKELAKRHDKPLLGANHIEGHLYSFLLGKEFARPNAKAWKTVFPAIGLVVSGGHTMLMLVKDLKTRKLLGETRDDAVGEAYDKVARLLGLPYPGGPEIEKLARTAAVGTPPPVALPRPMLHEKGYEFSFSGLKTSVLYYLRDNPDADKALLAREFQNAAVDVLVKKAMRAAEEFRGRSILLSGGVSANTFLRTTLAEKATERGLGMYVADFVYNTDNAAMIAVAAYLNLLKKKKYPLRAKGDMGM